MAFLNCIIAADFRAEAFDDAMLHQAASAGCDSVVAISSRSILNADPAVVETLADRVHRHGLKFLLQGDLQTLPADHPMVAANPEWFVQPGDRQAATAPVDPRRSMPAQHDAADNLVVAHVEDGDDWLPLADELAQTLGVLADVGKIDGFVIAAANLPQERLVAHVLKNLRTGGDALTLIAQIGDAGNGSAAVWSDHCDALARAPAAGILPGSAPGERRGSLPQLYDLSRTALPASGFVAADHEGLLVSAGVILPARALEYSEEIAQAHAVIGEVRKFSGPPQRLSAKTAPVQALMCAERADLRQSQRALLVFMNRSDGEQPVPATGTLSQHIAPFAADSLNKQMQPPLGPKEIRTMIVHRGEPVMRTGVSNHASDAATSNGPEARAFAAPRLVIENVSPTVEGGYAAKCVVGDVVTVDCTIFADGHEQLAAELLWRAADDAQPTRIAMTQLPGDQWEASFVLQRLGRHVFEVEAWLDRFGGFRRDYRKKREAGVAQPVDYQEGCELVREAAARADGASSAELKRWLAALNEAANDVTGSNEAGGKKAGGGEAGGDQTCVDTAALLLDDELASLMARTDDRPHMLRSPAQAVEAERIEARFSSWYELFPRSMGPVPASGEAPRHGTFADVVDHLPRVRAMGFDTLYFPPIHPIGRINRKGPNNTLTPAAGDPGSPYAIGSAEGGHDAIHSELGSFADFDRLVQAAHEHGLEIALDFAIQAAPDHPWLKEHPGWFAWRPDGSMKYAENPPKKYQDIVNVDFYGPDAVPGLWEALRDVILLWVGHGVKVFRVDNPHTKPLPFWEWMIGDVRARRPEVIFLSEAFTRPVMMYRLAKVGFSQSYTYFTWRETKQELIDYITELTTQAPREFYRPHFFVNTPDINPFFLQTGGRAAHRIRAVLAATLSGLWGVYSGFELCDATPLGPGKEEYLDSEKFELRPRDWAAPGNIIADVTTLNRLRRDNAALQTHLNTRFYAANDDHILWYGKPSPDGVEMIMVMVNLDPHQPHGCTFEVPLWEFGLDDNAAIHVEDLVEGHRFDWQGKQQTITLAPDQPYRIWRISAPEGMA
ncbi:alpha-1,4-glucan--maltose-1-phosphate maltosyltransferase [Croceicoccus sp. F390]|uniref:Alpha-1,4-glucan:maltose-1-phosphate maltosyltransferase n=1 Tax=Croceicoccus esteveae TaxID=3075597 RepID=A0ABU2ZHP2_9SPHN|nr:alpha-1,4-glucan--maltose-1-phosphate maltosyltransferase [Croceicoccus sp. F390]MDT0575706.1 alpha-1,4-glucan--maltose-1-phosphate maltosyltransferase [Croceicoccus sp. F390]